MCKKMVFLVSVLSAAAVWAVSPVVQPGSVTMTQDSTSRQVTISYTLQEAPGIVTVDIQTNGVSIGAENLTYFAGDVNKLVQTNGERKIYWQPTKAWPNNSVKDGSVKAVVTAWTPSEPPDYMWVDLVTGDRFYYLSAVQLPDGGLTNDIYKTDRMVFRKIPAENVLWRMGSPSTEVGRIGPRETAHYVGLTNDYYLGVFEVTQAQYKRVYGSNPAVHIVDWETRPVEAVSYEALRGTVAAGYNWPGTGHTVIETSFFKKLRNLVNTGDFDLPTDALWEFACRAGEGAALYTGEELDNTVTSTRLNALARYRMNGGMDMSGGGNGVFYDPTTCSTDYATAKVGSYLPNAWGLYDMYGNVWEWTLDWYQEVLTDVDPARGAESGTYRVARGGAFSEIATWCRSSTRSPKLPSEGARYTGFRVSCSVDSLAN